MKWKLTAASLVLAAGLAEAFCALPLFEGLEPFPYNEYYFRILDHLLRDCLLLALGGLLYYRRRRVPDRLRRYFPVVVTGCVYLAAAVFMVSQLSLDWGLQTTLSVLAGINNNILLLLVTAYCYHQWPGLWLKALYFAVYLFTNLSIVFDAFYFWQTSMHVESVLFQNLNLYAAKGVFATMSSFLLGGIALAVLAIVLLFRVRGGGRHKPNFVWSLLCAAAFTIALNMADKVFSRAGMYCVEQVIGLYAEVESEKTRMEYRDLISMPISLNFVGKALFDTDKLAGAAHVEQRELTDKDKAVLAELGIRVPRPRPEKRPAAYDRVVMLILESVHRDYLNYYNRNIPEQATPFLNSLVIRYPHVNKYYASAVPTIQGLNATFRSHLIMDRDLPGRGTPSLFRSAQAAGMRGIFMNASSQYYANELREYPEQYGMQEYYAREHLEKRGYTGASGWGFHNDVMYKEALRLLEAGRKERLLLVCKTLDMHQPYPYTGFSWAEMPEEVRSNPNFTVRGMYWVDRTLQQFFAAAEEKGLMDERTLFVITADHNPHSGGEYTKLVTNADDKLGIAPIPLIFVSKNLQPLDELRNNEFASQIDLAPTLLQLLGLEVPKEFMGRSLLERTDVPYALGYFGGKAYYWSEERHFVDQMDKPVPDSEYEDALSNYIVHEYGVWHDLPLYY